MRSSFLNFVHSIFLLQVFSCINCFLIYPQHHGGVISNVPWKNQRRVSVCSMKVAVDTKETKTPPNFLKSFFSFNSNAQSDGKEVEKRALLKKSLKELCKDTQNGNKCSEDNRILIEDNARQLANLNPTKKIATSNEMNGAWDLLYTTNGGSSSGKLGPFVGTVIQDINMSSESYDNIVALGKGLVEGSLTATWNTIDSNTWEVVFQNLVFKALGLKIIEKELKAKGIWKMTYLDEDLRILYAKGGKNTKQENIYILSKD